MESGGYPIIQNDQGIWTDQGEKTGICPIAHNQMLDPSHLKGTKAIHC